MLFSTVCFADWTGGVEAGARIGSDERPALRFYASNQNDPLSHYLYLDWMRESGGSSYRIGYNPNWRISHSIYSFGKFSLEQDDPGEVEREIDALVGIGNNLFQRGNTRVKIEAGIGARQLRYSDSSTETEDGFVFIGAGLTSSLLALLRFDASVSTKVGDGQTTIDSEAGVSIPIGPGTALRYVYTAKRYNLDNADNIVSEDSFFKLTYGF